jgi:hypothetical protein
MTRWEALVAAFDMDYLEGMIPWNADKLDQSFAGRSHGEKCVIRFLLNLWDRQEKWECGRFDLFEALRIWDTDRRKVFLSWANDPFWP